MARDDASSGKDARELPLAPALLIRSDVVTRVHLRAELGPESWARPRPDNALAIVKDRRLIEDDPNAMLG